MINRNGDVSTVDRPARVCLLTSAHPPFDARIFQKEAASLVASGYEVHLVAPGTENCVMEGVHIHAVAPHISRFSRMTNTAFRVYRHARNLGADVYHFHDPELMPFAFLLKSHGKLVIYDVHEDVPKDILDKDWIAWWLRKPIALAAGAVEQLTARVVDRVVAATPAIARRFPVGKTVIVQNFPSITSCQNPALPYGTRSPVIAHIGNLNRVRGAREAVLAMGMLPDDLQASLQIAGEWEPPELAEELAGLSGWSRLQNLGILPPKGVKNLLRISRIGLLLYHPVANHIEAQPTKLYEYMLAAIPIVASDFPLWREIVEVRGCGLCVDPLDPSAIAHAICWLLEHPIEAEEMGKRGREAVLREYNWQREAGILKTTYSDLLAVN